MDAVQLFRDQFNAQSEAEAKWLEELFRFVREHVWPLMSGPDPGPDPCCQTAEEGVSQLSASVLKRIRGKMSSTHTLPVSYRLVCVSELLAHQRLACVSNLSWSTNRERAAAEEAPGRRALPRAHLLLIGRLTHGHDGEWTLTDSGGSVVCEVVSPSPLWMGRLVFLPHWHYIPHSAPGQAQPEAGGYVELIGSPVLLCPGSVQGLAGSPVTVKEAAALVHKRVRRQLLSICGQVASVCPLLVISGTSFFFFALSDDTHTLSVLVKNSSSLWWAQCMSVGECVRVTALRVCGLMPWRGKSILCATEHSEMHKTHDQRRTSAEDTLPPTESQPGRHDDQSADRLKESRVISYQGTVTEVVSAGAGLYVMDGNLGLCLAYQPEVKRKLRVGDAVALHHVHFLYRPCPDFPPSMLCTCLRSTVRVTKFSAVVNSRSEPDRNCPDDGVLQRLLVEKNPDVSRYLWTCHLCSQLRRSLLPRVSPQCTCVLSWKLMELAFGQGQRHRRDIYTEMLDEPHTCPLTQYVSDSAQHQYVGLSELRESLQEDCWASLSLRSLLPPAGDGLTRAQMNAALAWSSRTLTSDPRHELRPGDTLRQRPLLLVGVLELPSRTSLHTLQLRDHTGAIACVVTETTQEEAGGQRAAFNTAWIGCLVCVLQFTMVTERFLQSNFPSYQHLDQHKFITHKHSSVYLQFSQKSIHILSPSVAMETHLCYKEGESGEEEKEVMARKRRREDEGPEPSSSSVTATTCVSVVLRVQQKNGVMWRVDEEASFSVTAAVIGPVATWGRDPKNGPMKDFEAGNEKKVTVVCSGASARWFPFLQPGCFYRLVASGTRDAGVLAGNSVPWRSQDVTLPVRSDWTFHTLTRPLLARACARSVWAAPFTLSQVLDGSADIVCFQGFVSDRIILNDRTKDTEHINIGLSLSHTNTHTLDKRKQFVDSVCVCVCVCVCVGVRLTVCDQSGRSIHAFLNFNHNTYPPGMLPGNTLLLSAFRRRVSRSGRVYCSNIAVSSVAVVRVRDARSDERPPTPIMHLAEWTQRSCTVGRVKGHVVCFLFMQLQWKCFECESVYTQSACSGRCLSSSAVFDCTAKLVIEDGTGQAHVHFAGALVRQLLALSSPQWEGLQRALKARGHIQVYPRGRSQECDDGILHFLLACVHGVNVLFLTCSRESQAKEEVKRLRRGKRDFLTRMAPTLKLTCLQIH
ncbi:CST complex subunit CTC1 isoform X2 [Phyllopteryx taeniolatus]|uniref:CST complex subunit CTC1 isoform X2 n=1 Tax=Phyllopteryx taeniolatus TaxID=161469 RepID=UPI002AD40A8D|nr:CST complex subunit CTC1 isoform X2 [Phyllopteryx taeniolatus]